MNATLNPYLNFNGKTAEAMRFYQSVLGGELNIQTFGDAGIAQNDNEKNLTLHAGLRSDDITLFASDGRPGQKVVFGDNVHLSLQGNDDAMLTGYFNGLAAGQVDMPLAKQFWGDTFGMLTDKFGVHWMVNITSWSAVTASKSVRGGRRNAARTGAVSVGLRRRPRADASERRVFVTG